MKVIDSTPAEVHAAVDNAFQPHPAPPRPYDLPGVVELSAEPESPFAEIARQFDFDPNVTGLTGNDEIEELIFRARQAGYRDGVAEGIELGKKIYSPKFLNK